MNFARCLCFLESNVYLKSFGLHVVFKTKEQFYHDYCKTLSEMGCTDPRPVVDEIKAELERRKRINRDSIDRTGYIKANYKPLHQEIFELQESFLHPDFLRILNMKHGLIDKNVTLYKSHEIEVFSFPIFNIEFCAKFIAEINHFNKTSMPKGRPNSMNNYGVLLDELGFNERLLTPLRIKYLEPLSQFLFHETTPHENNSFDSHKAFTVDYQENKDTDLDFHFDNSEMTVNICLLADCEGGELFFGAPNDCDKGFGYTHEQGRGVMHRGSALHCVLPLATGRRVNLVMWMRSSSVRNSKCPMCGEKPNLEPVEEGWGEGFTIQS